MSAGCSSEWNAVIHRHAATDEENDTADTKARRTLLATAKGCRARASLRPEPRHLGSNLVGNVGSGVDRLREQGAIPSPSQPKLEPVIGELVTMEG